MSGLKSRRKGLGFERECVNYFQSVGLAAERVPLSGAAGGSYLGDLTCPVQGRDRVFEAKRRKAGFKFITDSMGSNYGLIVRDDKSPALVILRMEDFARLAMDPNSPPVLDKEAAE